MNKNLIQALKSADAELSSKNYVKIDSELMSHISGGKSSGNYCTISGECNSDGHSCSSWKDIRLEDLFDACLAVATADTGVPGAGAPGCL